MWYTLHFIIVLFTFNICAFGQDSIKVIIVSHEVGEVIDENEKLRYHLFPFSFSEYHSAQFLQYPNSSIVLRTAMKNDRMEERLPTKEGFLSTGKITSKGNNINERKAKRRTPCLLLAGVRLRVLG